MQLRFISAVIAAVALTAVSPSESGGQQSSLKAGVPSTSSASKDSPKAPPGAGGAHPLDADDLHAWLDGLLPYGLKSGDIAGAVIAVVKDGHVLLQEGYGFADVDKRIPMDPERTLIRPGSTSKLFTWTAVMQLVAQGKIDLNRDVNAYLDFEVSSKSGKSITMLDLMNHRAGFEEGIKDILTIDPHELQSTATYLKHHPRPMLFAPGEVPAYSNYGASLAGYIVERVSGEPFERYVERHIFLPLGMAHSTFDQPLPERFRSAMSEGYRTASTPPQPYELITTRPAGSMTTTAVDMTHFMIAQLEQGRFDDHEILDSETLQLMHTPSETALPGFSTMAHGFFFDKRNGHIVIGHGGDTVFFHTEFDLLPAAGVGIFYNFNSRGRDNAVYALRKALFDEFMDRYFPSEQTSPRGEAPILASASTDALKIAGRYWESRRVEHGFLSVFYLLQQTVISANSDGTISAPRTLEPGEATFHEVAPDVWQESWGTRELALRNVDGVKTVIDSEDPTSVLQAVPVLRSAPLNLTVLLASFAILALTLALWPVSWLVRRHYHATARSAEVRRLRRWLLAALAIDLVYFLAWAWLLTPVLDVKLWVYSTGFDSVVRTLQLAGLLVIAAAVVGIWCLWRLSKLHGSRLSWVRNSALAAALLGIVWIGFVGKLFSFNLNY